jgi:DNA repair protein RecO (recombination protein O)
VNAPAHNTPAVVLRTHPVRESDLVVILLAPRRGKLETIARGARKSRRRFPSGLPIGARGEATVSAGRGSLLTLEGFSMLADHSGLGRDLTAFAYVAYMCELSDHLVVGAHGDPRLFAALCEGIEVALAGSPPPRILRRFELTLLDSLGLLPTFGHCCVCGVPLAPARESADPSEAAVEAEASGEGGEGGVAYDAERGGALCPRHAGVAKRLDPAVLGACVALLAGTEDPFVGASPAQRKGVRDLAFEVVRRHLRRPLKSLEFFAQLPQSRGR